MIKNKIYVVYQTTNTLNKKIYVGVHGTYDLDKDCYYGSGIYLLSSINKYGKINFEREILYIYHSKDVAYKRESYIVNKEFLEREDTMNLKLGGYGGWDACNTPEVKAKIRETMVERYGEDYLSKFLHSPKSYEKRVITYISKYGDPYGKLHSNESRFKSKLTQKSTGTDQMKQCKTSEAMSKRSISWKENNKDFNPIWLHTSESIRKSKETRENNGTYLKFLSAAHTPEVRAKVAETRKLRSHLYDYSWASNPEIINRIKETRKRNGTDQMAHCHSPEAIDKRSDIARNKTLTKYDYLRLECKLITQDGVVIKEGILYEVGGFMYGINKVGTKKYDLKKLYDTGNIMHKGEWKGHRIIR